MCYLKGYLGMPNRLWIGKLCSVVVKLTIVN